MPGELVYPVNGIVRVSGQLVLEATAIKPGVPARVLTMASPAVGAVGVDVSACPSPQPTSPVAARQSPMDATIFQRQVDDIRPPCGFGCIPSRARSFIRTFAALSPLESIDRRNLHST